jgi:trimeric autotransporter adhesin
VAGVGDYVNLSDGRYKKNINPLENSLDKILQLNGVSYDWDKEKADGKQLDDRNHIGFLAQDLEAVLPQAVSTADDAQKTKSVAYSTVIPVLVEAMKEQQKQIEALKKEIERLNKK